MKSSTAVNEAKNRLCSRQLSALPSPTNALRRAFWNPAAHAALATWKAKLHHGRHVATTLRHCTRGGRYTASCSLPAPGWPADATAVAFAISWPFLHLRDEIIMDFSRLLYPGRPCLTYRVAHPFRSWPRETGLQRSGCVL